MYVAESTLERALLEIYRQDAPAPGRSLTMAALQRAWQETGLRNDDFRDAVRILLGRGMLALGGNAQDTDVVLTPLGAARLASESFERPTLPADVADRDTLDRLRQRVAAGRDDWRGQPRRRADPSAPDVTAALS